MLSGWCLWYGRHRGSLARCSRLLTVRLRQARLQSPPGELKIRRRVRCRFRPERTKQQINRKAQGRWVGRPERSKRPCPYDIHGRVSCITHTLLLRESAGSGSDIHRRQASCASDTAVTLHILPSLPAQVEAEGLTSIVALVLSEVHAQE